LTKISNGQSEVTLLQPCYKSSQEAEIERSLKVIESGIIR